eukprot:9445178-Pyramimonas_sp.AAC.1
MSCIQDGAGPVLTIPVCVGGAPSPPGTRGRAGACGLEQAPLARAPVPPSGWRAPPPPAAWRAPPSPSADPRTCGSCPDRTPEGEHHIG